MPKVPKERPNIPLPVWAKTLLVLFIVGSVLFVSAAAVSIAWLSDVQMKATDPAEMPFLAQKIVKLDNPLPKQFAFVAAYPIAVVIRHEADKGIFWLMRMVNARNASADILAKQMAKQGSLMFGRLSTISGEGWLPVGGEQMY